MEDVAFVDNHGIRDLGAGRLLPGRVENLDDARRDLNGGGSLGLRERRRVIVVRPVPQPPQRVQVAPHLFHGGLTTVAEAKYQILMRRSARGTVKRRSESKRLATWNTA